MFSESDLSVHAGQRLEQLSPRQLTVARLVAGGLSNRSIATQLCVSVRTVESHLYAIFQRTGLRSRTELVSAMFRTQVGESAPTGVVADVGLRRTRDCSAGSVREFSVSTDAVARASP